MDEKEGEPTWRTELREAMDERFPFAQTMVTHDDVWQFVTPLIKAAEGRGRRQALTEAAQEIRREADECDIPGSRITPSMIHGMKRAADLIDPDIP